MVTEVQRMLHREIPRDRRSAARASFRGPMSRSVSAISRPRAGILRAASLLVLSLVATAAGAQTWQRAALDGIELEYRSIGDGEPIVFVHAGVFADWFEPLMREPSLASRYRLVTYHRVGYAGSTHVPGSVSIAQQAAHVRSLMKKLSIERAHVVGHSSGGNIALQLALNAPEAVRSLALLEMALTVPSGSPGRAGIPKAIELYQAGDRTAAVDTFMRAVAGPDYRVSADRTLPGAFDLAVKDADTFFGQELPALRQWHFGAAEGARIKQPVLLVMGGKSHEVSPVWQQRQDLLTAWLSNAEPFVLDGATHMLHLQNPRGMAERLVAFVAHHPLEK
jgi:pimeloyl-ACP methyl ester carboxylesterase